jgi:hypothetical protein
VFTHRPSLEPNMVGLMIICSYVKVHYLTAVVMRAAAARIQQTRILGGKVDVERIGLCALYSIGRKERKYRTM